jgi:ribosomal protein S27E
MPEQPPTHRHAYLVLAHEDVDMLNILTNRLVNTGFVYIHIDRKSPIAIEQVVKHPKVKVTKQIKVNWGGFSIVEATCLLADQALSDDSTRLTLLSGVSYPIVSDAKLKEFAESSVEYVEAVEVDLKTQTRAFRRRFTTRHFSFHLKQNLYGRIVRRISREFWALLPKIDFNKELGDIKLVLGSQWWSVTSHTYTKAMLLLEHHKNVQSYFMKIECSDESFFGTLFHHGTKNHAVHGTTYVKWTGGGGPKSIEFADIERESRTGHFLFVRKISSLDRQLLGAIDASQNP